MTQSDIKARIQVLENVMQRAEKQFAYMKKHRKKMLKDYSEEDYSILLKAAEHNIKIYQVELNHYKTFV